MRPTTLLPLALLAACSAPDDPKATRSAPEATSTAPEAPQPPTQTPVTARDVHEDNDLYVFDYSYPAAAGAIPALKDLLDKELEKARADRIGFLEGVRHGVFCELGAGTVNFAAVRAELERLGYEGWAVVEQDVDLNDTACPPPLESARKSRQHLSHVFGNKII